MKINPTKAGFYHADLSETSRLGCVGFKDVAISPQSQMGSCGESLLSAHILHSASHHLGGLNLARCHSSFGFWEALISINGIGAGSIIKPSLNYAEFPELKQHFDGISTCDQHPNTSVSLAAHV